MLYSLSIIPFLATALVVICLNLILEKFTKINRILLSILVVQVIYNGLLFLITNNTTNFTASWYLMINTAYFILLIDEKASSSVEKIILSVLYLNAIACTLEMALGQLAFFNDIFYEVYVAASQFLTNERGILFNTYGLQRRIINDFVLIRPSGLLGNLHLSSFAIFILYTFAYFNKYSKPTRWTLVLLIFISGNIQTMLCFLVFKILLIRFKDIRTLLTVVLSLVAVAIVSFITYGQMNHSAENDMLRILYDSGRVLLSTSFKYWLIGANPYEIIQQRSQDVLFSTSLIESGFFRYTMVFGLVNIFLGFSVVYLAIKTRKYVYKRLAFFVAVLASTIHYSMYTTVVGGLLVAFLITSDFNNEVCQENSK